LLFAGGVFWDVALKSTPEFFRSRLEGMVDPRHPLVVQGNRLDWERIEQRIGPLFARRDGQRLVEGADLFGPTQTVHTPRAGGRPRLPFRLMVSLLYLKHAYCESDESVCERWSENVVWQCFSGMAYYQPRLPCDPTQIGRFRKVLGEAGVEELLAQTLNTAVTLDAVTVEALETVVVDTTVQEKAVAYPTDSRLLEVARRKVALEANRAGIVLKQSYAKEGRQLRRRAGGYAHAKQFKRLRRVLKRQRTILGRLLRDVRRKMAALSQAAQARLGLWLERAERLHTQRPKDKGKLYAMHAPEVECIGKGKARQPYEFGVKVSVAISHAAGLVVGPRSVAGNPYDGHTLAEQLEQTGILLQDVKATPHTVYADLGYRGGDRDLDGVQLVHRGKWKSLTQEQRKALKWRQAVEPVIGHLKQDHGMGRCWLKGARGDALNAVMAAAGYNLRWLQQAIDDGRITPVFLRLYWLRLWAKFQAWRADTLASSQTRLAF
jgi:IS5 family transposase